MRATTGEMPDLPDFLRRAMREEKAAAPVVEAPKAPEAPSFNPKARDQMEHFGKSSKEAAADALQRTKDAGKQLFTDDARFMEGVRKNRHVIDKAFIPLIEGLPEGKSKNTLDHLREELHHEGYRARALAATEHYANQLPAALAAKVRETVNGIAKERWRRVNRPGTKDS